MKDVAFLRETEPRVCFIRKLLKDPTHDGASISGNGTELRQNHRTSCHDGIQDSHFFLLRGSLWFYLTLGKLRNLPTLDEEHSKLLEASIKGEILSTVSICGRRMEGRELFDSADVESWGLIGLFARRVHCIVVWALW